MLSAHGMRGEVDCQVLTDFPERFEATREVLVGDPPQSYRLQGQRVQGGRVVLKLEGVDDRNAAENFKGAVVRVPLEQAVKLPPGTYYWHEIIGLQVHDESGRSLGEVAEVLRTGSNDVYVVRGQRGELLLPAIRDVVKQIDCERGTMSVHLIPGLES